MFVESNPGYPYRKIQVPFGCGFYRTIGFTFNSNLSSNNSTSSIPSQSNGISLLQNQLNKQNNHLPQNIYPNINQNAPFSYLDNRQAVYYRRSISDFMKRVN